MLPGSRSDYRTTPEMAKWIILIVILGAIAFYYVLKFAMKNADDIFEGSSYSNSSQPIKDKN